MERRTISITGLRSCTEGTLAPAPMLALHFIPPVEPGSPAPSLSALEIIFELNFVTPFPPWLHVSYLTKSLKARSLRYTPVPYHPINDDLSDYDDDLYYPAGCPIPIRADNGNRDCFNFCWSALHRLRSYCDDVTIHSLPSKFV